jgi:hypothetical protein
MVCAHCRSESRRTGKLGAQKKTYVVRAIWASPAKRLVPIPRVQHMRCNWPFCARVPIQNCRRTPLVWRRNACAARPRIATKCANVATNMATTTRNVPHHDAKHAAGQATETPCASNAVSTSVRHAKERWVLTGAIRPNCPETLNTGRAYVEEKPKGKLCRDIIASPEAQHVSVCSTCGATGHPARERPS